MAHGKMANFARRERPPDENPTVDTAQQKWQDSSREDYLQHLKDNPNSPDQQGAANFHHGDAENDLLARPQSHGNLRLVKPAPEDSSTDRASNDQLPVEAGYNGKHRSRSQRPQSQPIVKPEAMRNDSLPDRSAPSDDEGDHVEIGFDPEGRPSSRGGTFRAPTHPNLHVGQFPTVKGDSYPPTTSGQPSVSDIDERQQSKSSHPGQTAGISLPRRGGARLPPTQNLALQNQGRNSAFAAPLPSDLDAQRPFSTQPTKTSMDMIGDGNVKSWNRSKQANLSMSRPLPVQQSSQGQVGLGEGVKQREAEGQVWQEREFRRQAQLSEHEQQASRQGEPFFNPGVEQQTNKVTKTSEKRNNVVPPRMDASQTASIPPTTKVQYQRQFENSCQHSDTDSYRSGMHGYVHERGSVMAMAVESHNAPRRADLDFEGDELYAQTFADLRAAPFDADPQVNIAQRPEELKDSDLQDCLGAALSWHRNDQADLISSLALEEWEEAGDWLLDQFGDVIRRLKFARQSKRRLARDFENEIQQRYDDVVKKRKLTDTALAEMRESGGRVLQATPSKIRRSK